jgi:hypothetical protein
MMLRTVVRPMAVVAETSNPPVKVMVPTVEPAVMSTPIVAEVSESVLPVPLKVTLLVPAAAPTLFKATERPMLFAAAKERVAEPLPVAASPPFWVNVPDDSAKDRVPALFETVALSPVPREMARAPRALSQV